MQTFPHNPCFNTLFHWETPGNHRFDLLGLINPTNKVNKPNYGSMALNTHY